MAAPQPPKTRQERRRAARAEQKEQRTALRREEPKRSYTLADCMKLGRTANILFVVFIIICLIYYYSLANKGNFVMLFELVAYTTEILGFVLFLLSVVWMARLVRARTAMKVFMIVYIVVEVLLMLLEFQLLPFIPYNGLSLALIIVHVLFSGAAAFSLLSLEPGNRSLEWVVIITTGISLSGMTTGIAGYRVYASVLINAFAYIFFFSAMQHLLRLEEVFVDCYGDQATVTSFDSTMFADTPTMVEKDRSPKTLKQRVAQARDYLDSLDDEVLLTDTTEKFEYEFGVDEYEDDDDEYEDETGDTETEEDDA